MVSAWWVLALLIGGGCLGMLIMALMSMAGGLPEQKIGIVEIGDLGVRRSDMIGPATEY